MTNTSAITGPFDAVIRKSDAGLVNRNDETITAVFVGDRQCSSTAHGHLWSALNERGRSFGTGSRSRPPRLFRQLQRPPRQRDCRGA
jgi:hypothetical protein